MEKQHMAQLSAARQWFAENYGIVVQTRVPGDNENTQTAINFDWDNAKTYEKDTLSTVEVPIIEGWPVLFADERTMEKLLDGEEIDSLHSLARLVIETNSKQKTTRSFIMTFVGSYEYLTAAKPLRNNTYLKREPDFDGTVLFYAVEGDFINGWKYKKGQITEKIIQKREDNVDRTAKTRMIFYTYDCYWVWTEYYWGNSYQFNIEITNEHEECYITGEYSWEREDGGGIPPGSAGGGSKPNPNNDDKKGKGKYPLCDKFFKDLTSLSEEVKELLENAIAEMLELCYGKAIYNQLLSKGSIFNSMSINSQLGGESAVVSSKGIRNLQFRNRNQISGESFYHEMFHLFQYSIGNYGAGKQGVMEFERALYGDIVEFVASCTITGSPAVDNIEYNKFFAPEVMNGCNDRDKSTEYLAFLAEVTNNATALPGRISSNSLNEWKQMFAQYSRAYSNRYDFNTDYDFTPLETALSLAQEAGCF
ncbi:MAG: hypothetical protein LBN06_01400 [Prevotellaceae bacterium]|nr:hypothetical protein [Prevotellaceae bacterium]